MEGPPAHRGQEECPHDLLHQRRGVEPEIGHPRQIVDGHPVEELHGQHVAAGELRVGLGHGHAGQVELVLQAPEVDERPGFVAEVHLLADLHPESVEHLQRRPGQLVAGEPHQDLQQRLHEVQIGRHHVLDARPQDLDGHHPPVVQAGPVHHRDRRGPDGLGLERREDALERAAEVLLHPLAHLGKADRRAGVEAGPEFVGHLVAEHPRRRGDDLPEFHERPAQVLEALAQRPGQLRAGEGALADCAQLAHGNGGEVHAHDLGDGGAPAQEGSGARFGQPPGIDPRHVLVSAGAAQRPRRHRRLGPWPCRSSPGQGMRPPRALTRPLGPVAQEKPASSAASAPL